MAVKEKIKVVWLCHFSNQFVHERLHLRLNPLIRVIRKLFHRSLCTEVPEFANWITNGIKEFEKIEEVELHIVSPYPNLRSSIQEFTYKNIHYHFFLSEEYILSNFIYKNIFHLSSYSFKRNRRIISKVIKDIHPDIVHLFGAENPYYSLGILDVPNDIVTIAQLQTLLNDPSFEDYYSLSSEVYQYRANVEYKIIQQVDYIGTCAQKYRKIIRESLRPDGVLLNTNLFLGETIHKGPTEKIFDFVYFAANLSKGADLALEAFGRAFQQNPHITLDVIGGYDSAFKDKLDKIIRTYRINNAVTFEGLLPTHEDVITQIRKSHFALLPLRVDLTSGTIREAMSNGLPVITTDTGEMGTQKLNVKRLNALISPIGDHNALAVNIQKLLNDNQLAETLRENAIHTRLEVRSNKEIAQKYVTAYKACIDNNKNNTPLPKELTEI